ncbi:MAG TPA: rhomboid family intramembrane serine protease [Rhabdochlamydiaceae bacterium]|jgi:GlpG protein
MRLIGVFDTEKEAYGFYSFLLKEGIQNIYELHVDRKKEKKIYRLWIYDEDDFPLAVEWLDKYKQHPEDPQFHTDEMPVVSFPAPALYPEKAEESKWQEVPPVRVQMRSFRVTFTHLFIALCAVLFFWNNAQKEIIAHHKGALAVFFAHTSLEKQLLFDYPANFKALDSAIADHSLADIKNASQIPPDIKQSLDEAEATPSWKGIYPYFEAMGKQKNARPSSASLFGKIKQGEVWRLFTPCLLHFDYLHILFNLAWFWVLGKQIQERIRLWKMGALILILGIVSNTAQYLVSGPSFIGLSGVIVGMAGFIWMRQRRAPWEGYPLSRATLLFLLLFVLAMTALGLLTFTLNLFSLVEITPMIANTAHIIGGVCGILLGRLPYFARGKVTA